LPPRRGRVSCPSTSTSTLFQLMEYHDSYDEGRPSAEALYVDGTRLRDRK
jgi:methylmalonyl-CoA/ethylmalonyl-CoA epimerase